MGGHFVVHYTNKCLSKLLLLLLVSMWLLTSSRLRTRRQGGCWLLARKPSCYCLTRKVRMEIMSALVLSTTAWSNWWTVLLNEGWPCVCYPGTSWRCRWDMLNCPPCLRLTMMNQVALSDLEGRESSWSPWRSNLIMSHLFIWSTPMLWVVRQSSDPDPWPDYTDDEHIYLKSDALLTICEPC